MSMNAVHRSIMIFSDDQEKANNKLYEIISQLEEEVIFKRKDYVRTSNKTIQAKIFTDSCRGYRYQDVYIDRSIVARLDDILAKLVPPNYYPNYVSDGKDYNLNDHIYIFN